MSLLRIFLLLIGMCALHTPTISNAQTYYNAPSSSRGSSAQAPLNLKSMLAGKAQQRSLEKKYTYQGKPYGVDRSSYSLALSPEQARLNQVRLNMEATNREREKERQRLALEARTKKATESATNNYMNQLQSDTVLQESTKQATRKRVLYNRDGNNFSMPKRVFNSPY